MESAHTSGWVRLGAEAESGFLYTKYWYIFTNTWYMEDSRMFALKGILRAETQEKVLLYLLARDSGYGSEIADFYGIALNPVQKQLARLEADGVVVSQLLGKVRIYQMNPRYPFIEPLKALLKSALGAYPQEVSQSLLVRRTRPRQAGKSLVPVKQTQE